MRRSSETQTKSLCIIGRNPSVFYSCFFQQNHAYRRIILIINLL